MATFRRFEDIEAWQQARLLTREIYRVSGKGDWSRDYALKDQIRRAAISVMSNIAEGFERDGRGEFIQFLSIAKGSVGELRSQLQIAIDQLYLGFEEHQKILEQCQQTARLINGLIAYLRNTKLTGTKFRREAVDPKSKTRNLKLET